MRPLILTVKDFTRFNNEFFKPMIKVKEIMDKESVFVEEEVEYTIKLMEGVSANLEALMREVEESLTEEISKQILSENTEECPIQLFPEKIQEYREILMLHQAAQYFNYIVERGNWIIHWYLLCKPA